MIDSQLIARSARLGASAYDLGRATSGKRRNRADTEMFGVRARLVA